MTSPSIATPQQLLAALDHDALRHLVARLVRAPRVDEATCHLHRQLQGAKGYNGLTCIVSVQYRSPASLGWLDLLLKWPSRDLGESRLYPLLMAEDAPVPRLEGTL